MKRLVRTTIEGALAALCMAGVFVFICGLVDDSARLIGIGASLAIIGGVTLGDMLFDDADRYLRGNRP